MSTNGSTALNKGYIFGVSALVTLCPVLCIAVEMLAGKAPLSVALAGKWFIFWASGVRLLVAGLKQVTNPAFTAKTIFNLQSADSHVIIRELGFANICTGVTALLSVFLPGWRIVSAFSSGLFYGIAGFNHCVKKPAGPNEAFALVSDLFIFVLLALYVVTMF